MTSRKPAPIRGAFTIAEAIAIAVVIIVLVAILLPALGGHRHHGGSRQLKDSSQVRGLLQGMILWAQSDQGRYPLPSRIDLSNATVAELAEAKDTTANIMSVLAFNSFFPPELLVSPSEANGNIVRMEGYELDRPVAAVDPEHALWDPALRADFTSEQESHVSYAHAIPQASPGPLNLETDRWRWTDTATHAAIGNRGPEITGLVYGSRGAVSPSYALGKDSLTFLIHGNRVKWEGNIGYSDNHVNFETSEAPESLTYRLPDAKTRRDCLFFDEPEAAGANNFLGIYIQAGTERKDFKPIWD